MILGTETVYNDERERNNNKKQQTQGTKENHFQSYYIIRLKLSTKRKKNHKTYKETEKYIPLKGKTVNQQKLPLKST